MKEEVHPTHGLSFFFVFLKDALTERSQRWKVKHRSQRIHYAKSHILTNSFEGKHSRAPLEGIAVRRSTGGEIVRIRSLEYRLP